MTELRLTDSYLSTVLEALAVDNTHASRGTLREIERQGVRLPVWIVRDVLDGSPCPEELAQ